MIRTTLAVIGRALLKVRYLLCWLAAAGAILLMVHNPGASKNDLAIIGLEIATIAFIYATIEQAAGNRSRVARDEGRADLTAEREKVSALMDLIHEHYLSAIRDHDMTPDSYERCRDLADDGRRAAFPQIYAKRDEQVEVEALAEEIEVEENTARSER
jgi:hypothetical protein